MPLSPEILAEQVLLALQAKTHRALPVPLDLQLPLPLKPHPGFEVGQGVNEFTLPVTIQFRENLPTLPPGEFIRELLRTIYRLPEKERAPLIAALRSLWSELLLGDYIPRNNEYQDTPVSVTDAEIRVNGAAIFEFEPTQKLLAGLLHYILLQKGQVSFREIEQFLIQYHRQTNPDAPRKTFIDTQDIFEKLLQLRQICQAATSATNMGTLPPFSLDIDRQHKKAQFSAGGAVVQVPYTLEQREESIQVDAHRFEKMMRYLLNCCGLQIYITLPQYTVMHQLAEWGKTQPGEWINHTTLMNALRTSGVELKLGTHIYGYTMERLFLQLQHHQSAIMPLMVEQSFDLKKGGYHYRLNPKLYKLG